MRSGNRAGVLEPILAKQTLFAVRTDLPARRLHKSARAEDPPDVIAPDPSMRSARLAEARSPRAGSALLRSGPPLAYTPRCQA